MTVLVCVLPPAKFELTPWKNKIERLFLWSAYLLPWTAGCWHHYATCIFIKRIWCIFFPKCISFLQLISMKSISITCFMAKKKISKLLHTQCMTNITCKTYFVIFKLYIVSKFQIFDEKNKQSRQFPMPNVFCDKKKLYGWKQSRLIIQNLELVKQCGEQIVEFEF